MGKYTDKFRRLVESPISREAIMDEAVNVEYEIARLQCEKAELEKNVFDLKIQVSRLHIGHTKLFHEEQLASNRYNALMERVKAHNTEMLAMCENNPKCVKKKGYRNIRCLDCPKENLIDLDTVVGVE